MYVNKKQTQPSHTRGSLVHSSELPIIQQGENLLISAALLHKKLKSGYQFSDWIKRRIAEYGFLDGVDYFSEKSEKLGAGRKGIDYLLTLDTAKELGMLEKNEVGRSIRRYFIQKEKELRGISQLPREAALFKGIKGQNINGRRMYPYRLVLGAIGYNSTAGSASSRIARYPGHFVKMGTLQYITEEFATHLYHQKRVYNNRATLKAMQPVLPFNFGTQPLTTPTKGGSL